MSQTSPQVRLSDLLSVDVIAAALGDTLPKRPSGLKGLFSRRISQRSLSDKLYAAFDVDLLGALAECWTTLEAVGRLRAGRPHETAILSLGPHHLITTFRPAIDFTVGKVALTPLSLEVVLDVYFEAAALTIRDGSLAAVAPGDCQVNTKLFSSGRLLSDTKVVGLRWPSPVSFEPPYAIGRDRKAA